VVNEDYVLLRIRINQEQERLARDAPSEPIEEIVEEPVAPSVPVLENPRLIKTATKMRLTIDVERSDIKIKKLLLTAPN
jgi:hypothetical protein